MRSPLADTLELRSITSPGDRKQSPFVGVVHYHSILRSTKKWVDRQDGMGSAIADMGDSKATAGYARAAPGGELGGGERGRESRTENGLDLQSKSACVECVEYCCFGILRLRRERCGWMGFRGHVKVLFFCWVRYQYRVQMRYGLHCVFLKGREVRGGVSYHIRGLNHLDAFLGEFDS